MSRKSLLAAALTATLMLGGIAAPAALAQDTDPNTTTSTDDNGEIGLWGLAGLLGLAGLAGLKRRDRYEDRSDQSYTARRAA